jgi:CarD family transcriptional regulator
VGGFASGRLPGQCNGALNNMAAIKKPAAAPKAAAPKPAAAKPVSTRHGFKTGESVVYPAHGVGMIVSIEEQEVAGMTLELFVIDFEKDKMRLKVPVAKAQTIGMRKLAETDFVERALRVVQGRARIKRTMWSRRAQEYDAKINSGDLIMIAEVVRDLYRADNQPEQSYSERQLYEAALDRMAREVAAVRTLSDTESVRLIEAHLQKGPRGRKAANEEAEIEEEADDEAAAA